MLWRLIEKVTFPPKAVTVKAGLEFTCQGVADSTGLGTGHRESHRVIYVNERAPICRNMITRFPKYPEEYHLVSISVHRYGRYI